LGLDFRKQEKIMEKRTDKRLASITAMGAFLGVEPKIREFCDEWILLTFDIPHTKEGDKARIDFYKKARKWGAIPHTESVYLMPWTPESEMLALDITSVGDAFIWISKAKEETLAVGVTRRYDGEIQKRVLEFGTRIDRIKEHQEEGKVGLANKMIEHSWPKAFDLGNIIARRGSIDLFDKFLPVLKRLKELEGR